MRHNTSRFNTHEINFQNMENEVNEEHVSIPLISSEKIQEQKEQMRWETTLKELKEGYFFTKYAKDGVKPHNKKVFLSNN